MNGIFRWIRNYTNSYIAVDLGTANTLIYSATNGLVLNEPSLVVVEENDEVVAVGSAAQEMMGRMPEHLRSVRPLENGVISDFDMCEKMLKYFIQKVQSFKYLKPKMVFCVPSGVTRVEQRAVKDAAEYAGARKPVFIIEEPVAAAIGSGLNIHQPRGNMIVDIGGGTTEVAVISLGGIISSYSARGVGGHKITQRILAYLEKEHSLAVGENFAEKIKFDLASAAPLATELEAEISGRDLETGLPRKLKITTIEIREAIEEEVINMVDAIRRVLEKEHTDPELAADIMESGIMLAGGGALLRGLKERIQHEIGIKTSLAKDPMNVVVKGSGASLENIDKYKDLLYVFGSA